MERRARIAVEWPLEGDEIPSRGTSILVSAEAACVELAVDGGEWRPCRRAGGLWRHDWSDCGPGRHQVLARARLGRDGDWTCVTRRFRAAQPR